MSRARLLVVDDEEPLRILFHYFFTLHGYQVRTAAEGGAALALLDQEPFDLVLTDLVRPGMDGRAFLQDVRARGWSIPVVVISAHSAGAAIAKEFGAVAFLAKPFRLTELAKLVQTVIDTRSR